jgi:hypothetical protein
MDRSSREYTPVMLNDDYPTESQPLTRNRYSNCSETDVEGSLPSDDRPNPNSRASSRKYIIFGLLLALVCNIASGCFGFYYGKRNLDEVCSSFTTIYCEFMCFEAPTLLIRFSWL